MRKRDNLATIALMCLSFLAPFNIFFPNHLSIKYKRTIFAEDKLHLAICKQAYIALTCIIFAEDKLHSAICKQAYIALICIIFAEDKLHSAICKQAYIALICIIFATLKT